MYNFYSYKEYQLGEYGDRTIKQTLLNSKARYFTPPKDEEITTMAELLSSVTPLA